MACESKTYLPKVFSSCPASETEHAASVGEDAASTTPVVVDDAEALGEEGDEPTVGAPLVPDPALPPPPAVPTAPAAKPLEEDSALAVPPESLPSANGVAAAAAAAPVSEDTEPLAVAPTAATVTKPSGAKTAKGETAPAAQPVPT